VIAPGVIDDAEADFALDLASGAITLNVEPAHVLPHRLRLLQQIANDLGQPARDAVVRVGVLA